MRANCKKRKRNHPLNDHLVQKELEVKRREKSAKYGNAGSENHIDAIDIPEIGWGCK